ncbi:hypothetical protein EVAR_98816_1 [Eumeta japonica]|uniref:Uncharacterized protein n=1 Tax=Eumeta variegata TaxID=151549 RepID=A0A4C2AAN2_EUMVA|nr:hypothetical protein EVAR_98816_1 [Eumeta japonica]
MLFTWHREAQAYATRRQDSTYVILNPRHPHSTIRKRIKLPATQRPALGDHCSVRCYRGVTSALSVSREGIGYVMASSIITPSPITCPIPITYQEKSEMNELDQRPSSILTKLVWSAQPSN